MIHVSNCPNKATSPHWTEGVAQYCHHSGSKFTLYSSFNDASSSRAYAGSNTRYEDGYEILIVIITVACLF
jgi:hypothetical protein